MPVRTFSVRIVLSPLLLGSLAAATVSLWPAVALAADSPPAFTSPPAIEGDAVVGATLKAVATWTGEPAPAVKYTWRRCPATGGACVAITEATAAQYVVTAADVGFRLGVRIQLKNRVDTVAMQSVTTEVVVAAPPPPPPPPPTGPPPPPTDPTPPPGSTPAPTPGTSFTEPVAPAVVTARTARTARLLRPFPVVRIKGYFRPGGVRVTLLSVSGPRSARVTVRCAGRGCPVRTLSGLSAPARLRPFERFLPAGIVLQVRVTSSGRIGKYASFVIRARSAPVRTDLCLMPGQTKPKACPSP
jgi:hypothetical protein